MSKAAPSDQDDVDDPVLVSSSKRADSYHDPHPQLHQPLCRMRISEGELWRVRERTRAERSSYGYCGNCARINPDRWTGEDTPQPTPSHTTDYANAEIVRRHAHRLAQLPAPTEESWPKADAPPAVQARFKRYREAGVIVVNGSEQATAAGEYDDRHFRRNLYQVDPAAYRKAQEYLSKKTSICCGRRAFLNVPGGEYECKECGRELSRKEIEEAVR